jgi:DNA-directed RNA polymerase specialized sigma subunit
MAYKSKKSKEIPNWDGSLNSEQKKLAEKWVPYANKVANQVVKKFQANHLRDDIVCAAYYGLCVAAVRYNHDFGVSFPGFAFSYIEGYARNCIATSLTMYVPRGTRQKHQIKQLKGSYDVESKMKHISIEQHNAIEDNQEIEYSLNLVDKYRATVWHKRVMDIMRDHPKSFSLYSKSLGINRQAVANSVRQFVKYLELEKEKDKKRMERRLSMCA